MLPKKHRLTKAEDFKSVYKKGRFFSDSYLAIKVLRNNQEITRFGFLVGIKISKKAVLRNKIKRRLREIIRLKLDKIKKGFDVVILTRSEIGKKTYQEIDETLSRILKKANLI